MRRRESREQGSVKLDQLLYSKLAHRVFWIGIILKAVNAVLEIAGALVLAAVSRRSIVNFVYDFFQHELTEDPADWLATHILDLVFHLSPGQKVFAVAYLLSHGVIKLFLVASLWHSRLWAYPLAGIVFSTFAAYQMIDFAYTHSIAMLALTVVDLVIIVLLGPEYRRLKTEIRARNEKP